MDYIKELESNSSPRIYNAAKNILDKDLTDYCPHLISALKKEMEKRRAWKTQCQLIRTIAITNCHNAIPTLKELIQNKYDSTILYKELGFSIFILENIKEQNFDFLYESFNKSNELQISGVCSALLFKKITPPNDVIRIIISEVNKYTENEGSKITPRCYIAALAYIWPKNETSVFLELCKKSKWTGLAEIAESSIQGKESKIKLI